MLELAPGVPPDADARLVPPQLLHLGLRHDTDNVDLVFQQCLEAAGEAGGPACPESKLTEVRLPAPVVAVAHERELAPVPPAGEDERATRDRSPALRIVDPVSPDRLEVLSGERMPGEDGAEEVPPTAPGLAEDEPHLPAIKDPRLRDQLPLGKALFLGERPVQLPERPPGEPEVAGRDRPAVTPARVFLDRVGEREGPEPDLGVADDEIRDEIAPSVRRVRALQDRVDNGVRRRARVIRVQRRRLSRQTDDHRAPDARRVRRRSADAGGRDGDENDPTEHGRGDPDGVRPPHRSRPVDSRAFTVTQTAPAPTSIPAGAFPT